MTSLSIPVTTSANLRAGCQPALDPHEATLDESLAMIEALARAMTARDPLTHRHAQRVQRYALALAVEAAIGDPRMLDAISAAALVHDIGKLGLPDHVLHKPGPLTDDEYDQIKPHAAIGANILSAVPFPGPLAAIVRHHHENWDGTGYPDRLRGDAIPIGARVLAVADCYDALTSDRAYRPELSHASAVRIIEQRRATMYDPRMIDAFLGVANHLQFLSAMERDGLLTDWAHTYYRAEARAR